MNKTTHVQIKREPTHYLLMAAKTQIMRNPNRFDWFANKDLDWDNIINYALTKTYGEM